MLDSIQAWISTQLTELLGLPTYELAAIVAAIAFLFLLIQTILARKPLQLPPLKTDKEPNALLKHLGIRTWNLLTQILKDFLFLARQSKNIYEQPRILLIGEHLSGKASLAASLESSDQLNSLLEESPEERNKQGWWQFAEGLLIDFESLVNQSSREELVEELVRARPERPVDAVVLCISSENLVGAPTKKIMDRGLALYDHMTKLQQELAFTFPVYVIITKTDLVGGFSYFWLEQNREKREERLQEVFGWSNPSSLEAGYSDTWVDRAFESMEESLRAEQLRVAAKTEYRTEKGLDDFFLFPEEFNKLRAPLATIFERLFRVRPNQADFFFRGLYFTGKVVPPDNEHLPLEQALAEAPVSFAANLFSQKVFAERNLARPIREGVWSRQTQVQRVQKLFAGLATTLVIALLISAAALGYRIQSVESAIQWLRYESISQMGTSDACPEQAKITDTLSSIGRLGSGLGSLFMPLSWVFRGVEQDVLSYGSSATDKQLLAGVRCSLMNLENDLQTAQPPSVSSVQPIASAEQVLGYTEDFLTQALGFRQNVADWNKLFEAGSSGEQRYGSMVRLYEGIYQDQLPKSVSNRRTSLIRVFDQANFSKSDGVEVSAASLESNITNTLSALNSATNSALTAGSGLIAKLNQANLTTAEAELLASWVKWINSAWLPEPGSGTLTQCEQAVGRLRDDLNQIGSGLVDQLGLNNCRADAESTLSADDYKIAALGPLLVAPSTANPTDQGTKVVSAEWIAQADRLETLVDLDFMQWSRGEFQCKSGTVRWDRAVLSRMQDYMDELTGFLPTDQDSDQPVDALAKQQLAGVLNSLANQAQKSTSSEPVYGNEDSDTPSVEQIYQVYTDFLAAQPLLTNLLIQYADAGLSTSDNPSPLASCIYSFAYQQLTSIYAFVEFSDALAPKIDAASSSDETVPWLVFGEQDQPDPWWSTALTNAEKYLGYSKPYVDLFNSLKSRYPLASSYLPRYNYWEAALADENKSLAGDKNNQIEYLYNFYSGLAGFTKQDCSASLPDWQTPALSDGLFSKRRESFGSQVQTFCNTATQAIENQAFTQLRTEFASLAGSFPFAAATTSNEATLTATRNFFLDYAADADSIKGYLAYSDPSGVNAHSNNALLNEFAGAVQFFNSHLAVEGTPEILNLNFVFRPDDAPQSTDATDATEDVLIWQVTNGLDTAKRPQGAASIPWYYGQPLTFSFSWAEDGNFAPVSDPDQKDLAVDSTSRTATFAYTGTWAFQRMIASHWNSGPAIGSVAPQTVQLKFEVPVESTSQNSSSSSDQSQSGSSKIALYVDLNVTTTNAAGDSVPVFVPQVLPQSFPKVGN